MKIAFIKLLLLILKIGLRKTLAIAQWQDKWKLDDRLVTVWRQIVIVWSSQHGVACCICPCSCSLFRIKQSTFRSVVPWAIVKHFLKIAPNFDCWFQDCGHCSYILFRVLFQTESNLVWKSYTQIIRRIFQTNSGLAWKEKKLFCKTQIPNQMQIGLENFDDHC